LGLQNPIKKKEHCECNALLAEDEGLEPPSLAAAVFKTADLPISLIFLGENKYRKPTTFLKGFYALFFIFIKKSQVFLLGFFKKYSEINQQ
jgi:hypothetical protein